MWTLSDINKFICNETVSLPCPICKKGVITFHPVLVMFPVYDETRWVTQVEVNAQQQSQTCQCDWYGANSSFAISSEAVRRMVEAFSNFKFSASRSQAEDVAHTEEVLAGQAY